MNAKDANTSDQNDEHEANSRRPLAKLYTKLITHTNGITTNSVRFAQPVYRLLNSMKRQQLV